MKTWIQHHDLFIEELGCTCQEEILDAFTRHDWKAELENEAANKGSDRCCRPAFGIEMDDNHVIQLYPRKENSIDLHYDYTIVRRKLGLFLDHKTVFLEVEGIDRENLDEVLYLHLNQEHQLLLEFLEAFGDTRVLGT